MFAAINNDCFHPRKITGGRQADAVDTTFKMDWKGRRERNRVGAKSDMICQTETQLKIMK